MTAKKKPDPCTGCGKTAQGDCSRAICPRRRPVTAQVGASAGHYVHFGNYRVLPKQRD